MEIISIAIDGPSGSGKSTVADVVARTLGILHLNTGSLYRAYALCCLNNQIDYHIENKTISFCQQQKIEVDYVNEKQETILNGEKVDSLLRDEKVGMIASRISSYSSIRDMVNDVAKKLSRKTSLVMEGRDIGSVVLKDSKFKFYIDANIEVRAKRRVLEFNKQNVSFSKILDDLKKRDYDDIHRKVAPLVLCDDAHYIDSSELTIEEVCERILNIIGEIK